MNKEITQPVLIGIISAVVIIIIAVGWFIFKPSSPQQVKPRTASMNHIQMLQRGGQTQQSGTGAANQ